MKARARFYTKDISPLAAFVRELCIERGLSFTEACIQMRVSTATVSNLARSKYRPSIGTVKSIADWAQRPITRILELAGYIDLPEYGDGVFHRIMDRITAMDDDDLHALLNHADYLLWLKRRRKR